MAIAFNLSPVNTPRQITSVGSAVSQLADFSALYHNLFDFIEGGGLDAFDIDGKDLARWNRNVRDGVVNIGGRPSELDFFRMMMGGSVKETDGTDLTIQYNSAVDYNIYPENNGTYVSSGTITGCTYANVYPTDATSGSYTGPYATFYIASDTYADNGLLSNINVGDTVYNYLDSKNLLVIKKDTTTAYAHQITVIPFDPNYVINIQARQPLMPSHAQLVFGYSDSNTIIPHTEWETVGYLKVIQPFKFKTGWETPCDLEDSYRDKIVFPVIFDTNTGAEMDSFDFKAMADGRERVLLAENVYFFVGETMKNATLIQNAATNKYFGFDSLMSTMFYGGGNILEFDPSYGFDIDVDGYQIIFDNDAQKKSMEFLMMNAVRFQLAMERRSQDMFKNNSGACTFATFDRMGKDMDELKRWGVKSYEWAGYSFHFRTVGAWSDSRSIGNVYFPNMGFLFPGDGLTDSKGEKVAPCEFWMPKGRKVSGDWTEYWRDQRKDFSKAEKFSGEISHSVMMSINGAENMYAIMPFYGV